MAEFCAKCFLKSIAASSDNLTEDDLIITDESEFCDGCCKIKPVVIQIVKEEL